MSGLRAAYLVHGDDHGAVAERKARLAAVVDAEGAQTSREQLAGSAASTAEVAEALAALRLGIGRRVIIVDGVERWKEAEVEQLLAPAMRQMAPETTLALFAYEDRRLKAPRALHGAVKEAGGQVVREATLKAWELPRWVANEGERLGLALDADAARALVAIVGERRQRLVRELEKLASEAGARAGDEKVLGVAQIELSAARSSQAQVFALADALVEGTLSTAILSYVRLRGQGERLSGLLYLMASRLRQGLEVATRLERGEPAAEIMRSLRMPTKPAERLIADAGRAGERRLREALGVLADLELHTRGGPIVQAAGPRVGALEEDTLALRAIEAIAGERS
jgi:DNA polymerase III subunit delta